MLPAERVGHSSNTNGHNATVAVVGASPAQPSTVLLLGFRGALSVGLSDVIDRDDGLAVVVDAGDDGFSVTINAHKPDLALIDADALASLIELRQLVLAHPGIPMVLAVQRLSRERDQALLAAGARAVLPFTIEPTELLVILRLVARGLVGPPPMRHVSPPVGLGLLTPREAQVLQLLAERRSAVDIATALHVSVATVNSHRRHIYEKLGVHSRGELAPYAAELR